MSQAEGIERKTVDQILKNRMPAIGIDLGGTKLSAALVIDYQVVGDPKTIPTPHGPDKIIDGLLQLIAEFQKETVVAGVGIATAGIVNADTGEVIGSTGNLPGWAGTPVKKLIESKTMLPTHIDNDANLAAYGEAMAMGLEDKTCVIGVTLGTGIGTGIVMKGQLYRGAHWSAGECGHIRIAMDNKRYCTCGLFDCWEAYGAGRGLVATAKEMLQGVTEEQSALTKDIEHLSSHAIVKAAQEDGDIVAQKAIDQWHQHLSFGLVSLAHTLDPDSFIISGGMSNVVDYDLLRELVADRTLPRISEKLEIHKSQLGNHAGIIGAAHVVLNSIKDAARN